ncbi:MAG TPA: alpha/beta hydrolase [Reyranella sp.]|nr:alpha/beta hydrolase [Reyranella sp.]
MIIGRRGLLAGVAALIGAGAAAALLNRIVLRGGYTLQADIPYGEGPRHKLDLYLPKRPREDGIAILFFHGGGWREGDKADNQFVGQALAARGVTVVIADYRLFPEVRFPSFLEDGARAVRWAVDRIGADKLFIMGHSAGAEIAAMLMADTPYLQAVGVDRMKLRGLIGLSGPYDFPPSGPINAEVFVGSDRRAIETITYVHAPLPPALLIHGLEDDYVPAASSERMAAAWRKAGAPVELKLYPGVAHGDLIGAFGDLIHKRATTRDDVLAWIDAH